MPLTGRAARQAAFDMRSDGLGFQDPIDGTRGRCRVVFAIFDAPRVFAKAFPSIVSSSDLIPGHGATRSVLPKAIESQPIEIATKTG
jgi:hypothetical protein